MKERETLLTAVKRGDAAEVERLTAGDPVLAAATDVNGVPAIMLAVYYGRPEVVPVLRRHLPELTAWEAAAVGDGVEVRTRLNEDPGRLNAFSGDGWTALHLAAFFGHPELVGELLERGAERDLVSRNGMDVTPLQSALASRQSECARLLIERGADVHGGESRSWPPIVYCAANDLPELAELLLARGADPGAGDPDGKPALAYAEEKGHGRVAEVLRRHGAC